MNYVCFLFCSWITLTETFLYIFIIVTGRGIQYLARYLDDNPMLLCILGIIRNLSFEVVIFLRRFLTWTLSIIHYKVFVFRRRTRLYWLITVRSCVI